MTGKGLTWTAAHLRAAASAEEVRTAVAEAATQLGDTPVPAATVLSMLEELALDSTRLRADLRAATRVREILLASVAHDLRNPLNTFAMSTGLLRDDLEGSEFDRMRALSLLSRMERASSRMQGSIEDLLEASRVEAGTVDLATRPEDCAAVVRAAVAKAKPLVIDKGASLEEGVVTNDIMVDIDRARTIDALNKLVSVALKTTGEGGLIRLGVEKEDTRVLFSVKTVSTRPSANVAPYDDSRGGLAFLIARGLVTAQAGLLTTETGPDGVRFVASFPSLT